jgi:hypothetical protein
MADADLLAVLQQAHFLRDLSEEQIEALASKLARQDFPAAEVIARQGAPVDGLYLIAAGRVEITRTEPGGAARRLAVLVPGDTLGEIELFFQQRRVASARALTPVTLYRWERGPLEDYLRAHPGAMNSLRLAATSRRLALRLPMHWLDPDEVIYGLTRKHPISLVRGLAVPVLLLAASVALWIAGGAVWPWLAGGLALAAVAVATWNWIDWTNDYYIVTNRRAVWLEKVIGLYDSRQEAPLRMVLSVTVNTEVAGRLLNYGDVIIRTFTGKIVFRTVESPQAMADLVEEHWRRSQVQEQHADREAILQALQGRLDSQAEPPQPAPRPVLAPSAPPRNVGLGRWTLQVRFEEKGIITYRKHWAVLLRATFLPSILILAVAGLAGARVSGLLDTPGLGTTLAVALLALLPLTIWWLYQYVDWANDIYQLTIDQILDIYKKPLAREERKVAPLENVLGTEVQRKGLAGLVLNYGNVIANIGTAQFVFEGVFDPSGVQQDIVRYQEALFERRREGERKRRQDEMVEWLGAYHQEVAKREADGRKDRTGRNRGRGRD